MDEGVIKYYRNLLREDFPNSGVLDQPAIFVETIGERLIDCGNTGNYMQLYLKVDGQQIVDIKYLCSCEPVANVAVEVLCTLLKGKTLVEAENLTEQPFFRLLESQDEELKKKVFGLMEILKEGITQYHNLHHTNKVISKESDERSGITNTDGSQSV